MNQNLNIETLTAEFSNAPEETHFLFPYKIRAIIKGYKNHVNLFEDLYKNNELALNLRFKAFYAHSIVFRQNKELAKYRDLIDTYSHVFEKYKLFDALLAQYFQSKIKNKENLAMAVQYSEKAIASLPMSPNVLHLFVELVADFHDYAEQVDITLLNKAEREISNAIAINGGVYAKYYATKARILAYKKEFRSAKDAIQLAIEIEPSDNPDYPIRIGDYQSIKTNISYIEYTLNMETKQAEAVKNFEEIRNKVVELLGLLSAIIAFVITSVQITKDFTFENASKLLIVMGGTCVVVFSTFSFTFFSKKIQGNQVMAVILGFLMIFIGLML